jgi:hypothetical protein
LFRDELTGGSLHSSELLMVWRVLIGIGGLAMKRLLVASILTALSFTPAALAGNTSSNSSSNSSNGVHTRVDTITTDDGRGRRIYERRSVRIDADRRRPAYMRDTVRERYGHRSMRRWQPADDDDD